MRKSSLQNSMSKDGSGPKFVGVEVDIASFGHIYGQAMSSL